MSLNVFIMVLIAHFVIEPSGNYCSDLIVTYINMCWFSFFENYKTTMLSWYIESGQLPAFTKN